MNLHILSMKWLNKEHCIQLTWIQLKILFHRLLRSSYVSQVTSILLPLLIMVNSISEEDRVN